MEKPTSPRISLQCQECHKKFTLPMSSPKFRNMTVECPKCGSGDVEAQLHNHPTNRSGSRRLIMRDNKPAICQGELNGWSLSWNPDDNRFYLNFKDTWRSFKEWRNTVYYARTHKAGS